MAMPTDLILVRHGESEGNVAARASGLGDISYFTDDYRRTPGRLWRLTPSGQDQAREAGRFIRANVDEHFFRYYVSPYVRARETAALLGLPDAQWRESRLLRERDYGDVGSMPRDEYERRYPDNALVRHTDPLYWKPPGGESIADIAEGRFRNILDTFHRECSNRKLLVVTHGEMMWAARLVLERMTDDDWLATEGDTSQRIGNGDVLHYSRIDPDTQKVAPYVDWLRHARPHEGPDSGRWIKIRRQTFTNEQLVAGLTDAGPEPSDRGAAPRAD